jgi:hypothetical protein
MKTLIKLGFLFGLAVIAGCVTPGEKAKMEAQQRAENARLQSEADVFHDGWAKLQKGMSAQQVSDLLGGVPPPSRCAEIDQYSKQGLTTEDDNRAFKLVFDGNGLVSWMLHR